MAYKDRFIIKIIAIFKNKLIFKARNIVYSNCLYIVYHYPILLHNIVMVVKNNINLMYNYDSVSVVVYDR